MMYSRWWRLTPVLIIVLGIVAVSCSSNSPTSPPVAPTTSPTTTAAAAPPPVSGAPGCSLGYGNPRYTCQGGTPELMPYIDAAIDRLVAAEPHLFDLNGPAGTRGYLILDLPGFYAGITRTLAAQGLCTHINEADGQITIKIDNSYDQTYDLVSNQQRVRTGPATYLGDCTPARYPQQPGGVVRMRVSFFRLNCPAGIKVPAPESALLPEGCIGTITATPLDGNSVKVPLDIHGEQISWFFRVGEAETVYLGDQPDEPFNQKLYTRSQGVFSICASVPPGIVGCLNGNVVPAEPETTTAVGSY
jgi:hypothetical protein